MKSILSFIAILFLTSQFAMAQAPQKFRYQAVARNNAGAPYANTSLKVRFQILQDSDSGALIYFEEHTIMTTNLGVFDANIGGGTALQGTMAAIDWANHSYFVLVQLNTNLAGGAFTTMGASQLLSVPYALYAEKSAGSAQQLSISGNQVTISGGNTITLPPEQDGSTTNELQTISLVGNQLTLSQNGSTVTLPSGGGSDNQMLSINGNQLSISNGNNITIDGSAGNELQQLSINGNQLSLSQNGGSITLPSGGGGGPVYTAGTGIAINNNVINNTGDNSVTNEIQTISINGNQLSLSQNGGSVTLPAGGGGGPVYTAGTGIAINNNVITNTGDNSVTNEIQTVTLVGNQLALSQGGGMVTLPTGTTYTAGTGITINANTIYADDPSITNEIQQLSLNGNQLALSQGGGTVTLPSGGGVLTLPYLGTGSTPNSLTAAFEADNSGAGVGIIGKNNGSGYYTALGVNNYSADFWGPARIVSTASASDLQIADAAGDGAKIELESGGATWTMQSFGNGGSNFNILDPNGSGMWLSATGTYLNQKDFLMYQPSDPTEISMTTNDGSGSGSIKFRARSGANNESGLVGNDNFLVMQTGGANRIDITHSAQYTMEPWTNASVDLGRSSYRWDFLYCVGVNQSSDGRLKEKIQNIEPGLATIMQMRPVDYYWKNKDLSQKKQYGFIAQELEAVLPDAVSHDVLTETELADLRKSGKPMPEFSDSYGINYTAITPVLVKGMQEQQQTISAQQAKIEKLEAEMAELKSMLTELMKK
jgi:hypothetical protein